MTVCESEGAFITKAETRSEIRIETERLKRVLHTSLRSLQISPACGLHPSLLQRFATHTHVCTTTDVTRIQKVVAAYYIRAAHAGYLAQLGLFKRPRLDEQRGFCTCGLLAPSLFSLSLQPLWPRLPPELRPPRHPPTAHAARRAAGATQRNQACFCREVLPEFLLNSPRLASLTALALMLETAEERRKKEKELSL